MDTDELQAQLDLQDEFIRQLEARIQTQATTIHSLMRQYGDLDTDEIPIIELDAPVLDE